MPRFACTVKVLLSIFLAWPFTPKAHAVIVGKLDWYPAAHAAPPITASALAVGRLMNSETFNYCTATLVAQDVVLTNAHCLAQHEGPQSVSVYFEAGGPRKDFDCDELLYRDQGLDAALLRCKGSPSSFFPTATLSTRWFMAQRPAYLIHYNCDFHNVPGCDPQKLVSPGGMELSPGLWIWHYADTLNESSGAPLFDSATHAVSGLHKGGFGDLSGNGRGSFNRAVPMRKIVAGIQKALPWLKLNLL